MKREVLGKLWIDNPNCELDAAFFYHLLLIKQVKWIE